MSFLLYFGLFFFGMNNSRRLGIYFGHKTFHSSASVGKMVDPAAKNMGIQRFCPFWQREGFDSTGFFVGLDSKPRSETGSSGRRWDICQLRCWPANGGLGREELRGVPSFELIGDTVSADRDPEHQPRCRCFFSAWSLWRFGIRFPSGVAVFLLGMAPKNGFV